MSVEVITLGCRLNTYESEVIRAKAREAGLDERRHRQHLRGDERGRAPGAAADSPLAQGEPAARGSS